MLEVLTRISEGRGRLEDLGTIRRIADGMTQGSLCGLGQLTPGPVMSALRHFEDEFRTHILEKRCPAGACKTLTPARCTNACPAEVERVPSLQPACTYPVSDGLNVATDTPRTLEMRKFVLEMLFSERNHYCMFCEMSGNCELQNLAYR